MLEQCTGRTAGGRAGALRAGGDQRPGGRGSALGRSRSLRSRLRASSERKLMRMPTTVLVVESGGDQGPENARFVEDSISKPSTLGHVITPNEEVTSIGLSPSGIDHVIKTVMLIANNTPLCDQCRIELNRLSEILQLKISQGFKAPTSSAASSKGIKQVRVSNGKHST